VKPFSAGEATLYGFRITPALAAAMQAMLIGDVDAALGHLDAEDPPGKPVAVGERLYRWFLSAYRAHILNLAGRAPEAEQEALRTRDREIALRGSDLIARVLRGDARIRLGDLRAGDADYAGVLRVLGPWEFPTRFGGPPANQVDLAILTEAKSRAYLSLAVRYALEGQYQQALTWGTLTEQHFAAVFSVMNHPLYGPFMGRPHHDIYMARAVNLSFLAAAKQALGHAPGDVARLAEAARSYYDAIGFPPGHVYLESLHAKALFDTGHPEEALLIGRRATKRAQELNLPDFVWRVEALMGEGLLRAGRKEEAERALRDAQIAVDRIVGALGSDRDKRRFGVNKENITVFLTSLDFERRDARALFQDLERGRARAFVDMLAAVDLSKTHRDLEQVREVSRLARQKVLASELGQAAGM
jgi:tetratricopeptide (TPR) repeat protein